MNTASYLAAVVALVSVVGAPMDGFAKTKLKQIRHIVLDPGHGGTNPGAPSVTGVYEKYITLPIALEIERQLRDATDVNVTLTRRGDTSIGLRERTRLANEAGGDLLISIHCNSSENPEANGLEVYFLDPDAAVTEFESLVEREERGEADAHAPSAQPPTTPEPKSEGEKAPLSIDQVLLDASFYKSHERSEILAGTLLDTIHKVAKIPRRKVRQAAFAVLKEARMPAVVLEVGYLSHASEGKKLIDPKYQEIIARGVVKALIAYDKTVPR
ncbi:MAG: N-acetylmuramoyl-L-alanine amidase [Myxococcales bacterium]|nr:N-acetylmuramoyl-L-alanine amidase [Myxococcales bacterium]